MFIETNVCNANGLSAKVNCDTFSVAPSMTIYRNKLSCKIFEHFALQVDPVIEFLQLGFTPFKRRHHFGTKTSWSTFLVEKLDSIPSKSGSGLPIRIDAYFALFKDVCYWNTVTYKPDHSCQVFYYKAAPFYRKLFWREVLAWIVSSRCNIYLFV